MTSPSLIWGSPGWITAALVLLGSAAVALLWSYGRARAPGRVRACGALLKAVGLTALAMSLLEPLLAGTRPRRGANAFVVLADNSQSLQIRDGSGGGTRGDWARTLLRDRSAWKTRLGQDFDLRSYLFDANLRAVGGFEALTFDGNATSLSGALASLSRRFRGLPLAGILLITDGNATDKADVDWSQLPPIYPVVPPSRGTPRDVGLDRVSISQTNFDSAPVVVQADVSAVGYRGATIVAAVTDEAGKEVGRQDVPASGDGTPRNVRFQFRPDRAGVSFYRVRAFPATEEDASPPAERLPAGGEDETRKAKVASTEQTLANNSRLLVNDQGGGPYRILYLSGRPNWEFKFLRRALADDEQVQLVGLLRIARRQPKFDFRNPRTRPDSPLFDGFDNPDADTSERSDQPVLVRLGTLDEEELRDGFPRDAAALYRYHAIILDDLEAGFFTQDQLALLRGFVSRRGGGLLMLGGPGSFADGRYDRTPVGELLPVYLDRPQRQQALSPRIDSAPPEYRLVLTREGWLQPWVRTRATEDEERKRLDALSTFRTLSRVGTIKPGAVVLAQVRDAAGELAPALVSQPFGKGHVAALLIGDLWRSGLRRERPAESDLDRSWRQTARWLVGDVPSRVEVQVRPSADAASPTGVTIAVRVHDAEYRPLDNAKVALRLTLPGGDTLAIDAEPDGLEAGSYAATYVPRRPGAYRVAADVQAPDGAPVGRRESGWASQPTADEFARLEPNRAALEAIANRTGGALVEAGNLPAFVAGLASSKAPISEPWTSPLWHHPLYFLIAIACLAAEWGVRRVNGLA